MHLSSDCRVQTSLEQARIGHAAGFSIFVGYRNVIWRLGLEVGTRRAVGLLKASWAPPSASQSQKWFQVACSVQLKSPKTQRYSAYWDVRLKIKTMRVMRCFCFALWTGWRAWGGQHRPFQSGTWSSGGSSSRRPAGWVSTPSSISTPSRRSVSHCRCPWQPQLPADNVCSPCIQSLPRLSRGLHRCLLEVLSW